MLLGNRLSVMVVMMELNRNAEQKLSSRFLRRYLNLIKRLLQ